MRRETTDANRSQYSNLPSQYSIKRKPKDEAISVAITSGIQDCEVITNYDLRITIISGDGKIVNLKSTIVNPKTVL